MSKYFGFAQCNECKDVEGPWVLVKGKNLQRFLCESCYEKLIKKNKQQITSKTESRKMT